MASSADSPENARQRRAWLLWQELLPGIEEFLLKVLPAEHLSRAAEERRQYFAERLDILKLPPSLPPRAGKRISVELLQETEKSSGIPADQVPEATELESEIEKDFAAKQREISRNLLASVSTDKEDEEDDTDSSKGVKVYDDIDPSESTKNDGVNPDDDDDINALYEIPIARQNNNPPPTSEDSLSQPADVSSLATAGSVDDVSDDVLDAPSPSPSGWQPPPLPPRKKKSESDSRHSVNSLEDRPPELPFRPPLPRRHEIYARSERSDKSEKSEKSDVSDGDSTSYESFDEHDHGQGHDHDQDQDNRTKDNIRLPKRPKKKSKSSSKLLSSKARSSSTWEVNMPFKKLDNVQLSGDLQHRGKLTWNRRLVAISNGSLALYKPDKEGRPVFVLPLTGYQATVGERDGKKGFEIRLTHKYGDTHLLTADFKEWASIWCDQINAVAQGLPAPSLPQHLARTFSGGSENSAYGSRPEFNLGEITGSEGRDRGLYEEGDYEMYEEYATDTNSVFGTPPPTPQTRHNDVIGMSSPASTGRLTSRLQPSPDTLGLKSPASTGRLHPRTNPDTHEALAPAQDNLLPAPCTVSNQPAANRLSCKGVPGLRSPATLSRLAQRLRSRSEDNPQRAPATLSRLTQRLLTPRSENPTPKASAGQGRLNSRQWMNIDTSTSRLSSRKSTKAESVTLRSVKTESRLIGAQTHNTECQGRKAAFSTSRLSTREAPHAGSEGLTSQGSSGRLPHARQATDTRHLSPQCRTSSTLTLSRWDWKTLFYNWAFPLDHFVLGMRRGNLSTSNSNLSVSSDGVESDDSSKPVRLRGAKVMRMGSFAYRATQFFENLNLGKKTTSKRKTGGLNAADSELNLRDGIQEESSLSSNSQGLPISPSSDLFSPVFVDGSVSPTSPTTSDGLPSPAVVTNNVKHQGYLNIFSSFNKRRWGQRWCLVRENMFECYKSRTSHPCELNFLLKNCVLRQAIHETNSQLAIMLLENNKEKITVEPPNKNELSQWLRVLMVETATVAVPEGLEEFFVDTGDDKLAMEAEYSDIMSATLIKSWEVGTAPVLSHPEGDGEGGDHNDSAVNNTTDRDSGPDRYVYTEVVKRPSASSLQQVCEENSQGEEDTERSEGSEGRTRAGQRTGQERGARVTDNLAVTTAHKYTTDSGFYSVREASSDSDSGSELREEEEASPRDNGSPPPLPPSLPPPFPTSSPPRHTASSPSAQEPPPFPCNTSNMEEIACSTRVGRKTTDFDGDVRRSTEDEEAESALERTLTAEDFSRRLEHAGDDSSQVVTNGHTDSVQPRSDGAAAVRTVRAAAVTASTDCAVLVSNSPLMTDDSQQHQKTKKKKKKSKNKKNKHKQQTQEDCQEQKSPTSNGPVCEHNGGFSVNTEHIASSVSQGSCRTHSDAGPNLTANLKPTVLSEHSNNPLTPSSASEENQGKRKTTPSSGDTNPSSSELSVSALEGGSGGELAGSPEDNETISELRERLGRLREKLIQIKRKRIAVRDKRVRAFSAEERAVCDKEYLVLEAECKEHSALIQALETELKAAVQALQQS